MFKIGLGNLLAFEIDAACWSDAEELGHDLQALAGQIHPPDRVDGVQNLPPCTGPVGGRAPVIDLPHPWRPLWAAQIDPEAQHFRPPQQKRQVKSADIVVLDDVRVALGDDSQQVTNHARFFRSGRGFQHRLKATVVPHGNHENPPFLRRQAGGFQVELQAYRVVELHPAERGAPRLAEVLLYRGQRVIAVQVVKAGNGLFQAA